MPPLTPHRMSELRKRFSLSLSRDPGFVQQYGGPTAHPGIRDVIDVWLGHPLSPIPDPAGKRQPPNSGEATPAPVAQGPH